MYCAGKKTIYISGPFLFTEIWWEMEVDVNMKTKNVQHTPRYRLKPEWNQNDVTQYLIQCGILHDQAWNLIHKIFGKMVFSVSDILEFTELDEKIQEGGAKFSNEDRGLYYLMIDHLSGSRM